MADMTVNEWFQNANAPMLDIANMLIALDIEGKLPEGMREAIKKHAEMRSCVHSTRQSIKRPCD